VRSRWQRRGSGQTGRDTGTTGVEVQLQRSAIDAGVVAKGGATSSQVKPSKTSTGWYRSVRRSPEKVLS
jgi:hypothetical protein